MSSLIDSLERAFSSDSCSKEDIVRLIGEYLPGFHHIETGKGLDGKM